MTRYYALARKDGSVTILQAFVPVGEVLIKWHPTVLALHTGEYKEIAKEDIPSDRAGKSRAWFDGLK
jgi:hypothetical protein